MEYSEVGLKYVENLTNYSRKQIKEILQGKGNYTKYNRDKVTTLYTECASYPLKENVEIIPQNEIERIREPLLKKVSLNQISKKLHCVANGPSYFTRLKLDEINYSLCKKIDNYLKDNYQFDLLKECDLPEDYFESYYNRTVTPNKAIKKIADDFGVRYNYALRIINRLKTNPTFVPRTKDSKELNRQIKIVAKKEGLL